MSEILAEAEARPDQPLRLLIEVPEPGFDWAQLREAPPETALREQVIETRRQQVGNALVAVLADIQEMGVRNIV